MLDAQAWRAARLVVDTGLHALRWPRQRSIDFLRAAGLSETDAVDRDRPLHLLARPGADLQDRPARDRAAAPRARGARRLARSTCARSTTRSSATARCRWRRSPRELPELGGDPGLTGRWAVRGSRPARRRYAMDGLLGSRMAGLEASMTRLCTLRDASRDPSHWPDRPASGSASPGRQSGRHGLSRRLGVEADPERVERLRRMTARRPSLRSARSSSWRTVSTATERSGSGGNGIGGLGTIRSRSRSSSGRRMKSRTTPPAQRLAPTPSPV